MGDCRSELYPLTDELGSEVVYVDLEKNIIAYLLHSREENHLEKCRNKSDNAQNGR